MQLFISNTPISLSIHSYFREPSLFHPRSMTLFFALNRILHKFTDLQSREPSFSR